MFSSHPVANFNFQVPFILWSASAFIWTGLKLLFGKELNMGIIAKMIIIYSITCIKRPLKGSNEWSLTAGGL